MNKQDRQNKTILKRERERNSSCLPAPCSPFANVTIGESSTLSRKRGLDKRSGTTHVGKGARARHGQREADLGTCILSLLNAGRVHFPSRAGC